MVSSPIGNLIKITISLAFIFSGLPLITNIMPAYAADPPAAQEAPGNPAFDMYKADKLKKQAAAQSDPTVLSEPSYGYVPHPFNLGHIKDLPVQKPLKKAATVPAGEGSSAMLTGLPASFDWRTTNKVTPIRNQNPCGTCWIFGSLASLESRVSIIDGTQYDFSEQNVATCVNPAWTYLTNNKCDAGGDSYVAFDTLSRKGTRLESCDPYNSATIDSAACNANGCPTLQSVTGFRIITDSVITPSEIDLVKNAVYNYGPLSMAFYWTSGYLRSSSGSYTNVYYGPTASYANHLVSIVGWDDSVPHPSGGGSGAWIVKNSWGTGWGNAGYFYMCYGSGNVCEVGSFQGYKAYDQNEKLYLWDELGLIGSRGYGDTSAWMASVFTASPAGSLTHVDFWTTSNNAQYQINILNGSFGSQLTTQSGTCTELGYYSIPLNNPVALTAGQQFTVSVKMTTPGNNSPIPVEYNNGWGIPTIQANVSFMRYRDTDSWSDLASAGRNAVLRARVNSGTSTVTAPSVTNSTGASNITANSASLNGNLTSDGGASTSATVYWGTTDGSTTAGNWANHADLGIKSAGAFSADISGLTMATTYYYRCYAQNAAGSAWAATSSFFVTQQSTLKLVGATDVSATGSAAANYLVLTKWTASASGSLNQIKVKCSSAGNVKAAIYADSAGSPGTLLGANNTGQAVSSGWNTINLPSPVTVTAGTAYWLASNSDTQCANYIAGSGSWAYKPLAYSSSFPASAGTDFITVAYYSISQGWGTPPVLTITTTSLPSGTQGTAYTSTTLTSTGGSTPYTWSVLSGSLPAGLSLAPSTGVISGTPSATGTSTFTIRVTDSSAGTDTQELSITIASAPPLDITTTSLTAASTGSTYSQSLSATGGISPYTWAVSTGSLPAGLTLNTSTGVISGIPSTTGTSSFSAQVTDSLSASHTQALSVTVTLPSSKLVGATDVSATGSAAANYLVLTKWTASASGSLNQIKVKCSSAGNVKAAIYADSAGSPGTLLGANNTGQAVSSGWNTINLPSPVTVTAGTAYWLASNSDTQCANYIAGSGSWAYKPLAYSSSFPASAGTDFITVAYYSISQGWGTPPSAPSTSPELLSPATSITFKWGTSTGVSKYWLQVNTSQLFTGTDIVNADMGNLTLQEITGFSPGTTYYWRVKAGNDGGWSAWSATKSVLIN